MLAGDDVLDFKGGAIVCLGDATVFTAAGCPVPNQLLERLVHVCCQG